MSDIHSFSTTSLARTLSTRVRSRLGCAALAGLVAWSLACGGDTDDDRATQPTPPAGASSATQPSDTAAPARSEAAPTAGAESEESRPEGYPGDLPVYPGASPAESLSIPGAASLFTWTSDDSSGEVLEFYRHDLASAGWTIREAGGGALTATKGPREITVSVNEAGEGSEIAVGFSED